ncbi:hypothetical protein [Luteitalea sp.]
MPNHVASPARSAHPYVVAGAPLTGTVASRLVRVDGRLLLLGKALEAAASTPDALEFANEADRVLYWLHLAEDVAVMREELRQAIKLDASPGRQAVAEA